MQRSAHLFLLTALTASLANCYGPDPRPFAGRGGRSLDEPPRYGDPNRYVEPIAPTPPPGPQAPATIDPTVSDVDQGLSVTPPGTTTPAVPGGAATPTVVTPPVVTTPPTATPPAGDAPFARAVPGKPGFVYSPKDPKKIISVEGLRPGQKARDPETGDIFRVPY